MTSPIKAAFLVCIVAIIASPALARDSVHTDWTQRAASGDLSQPGGARRLRGDITDAFRAAISNGEVKYVILFIGDGMGDSEITLARNYAKGAGGFFRGIDALPITGQYTHYSLHKDTGKPDYVTDSAASGSEWATGVKTYNGAISVDIRDQPHETLLELAKAAGFGTGDITTAEIQDATPAVLVSHVTSRRCFGPEATSKACPSNALENGGAGSITEQMLNTRPDIIMGGGARTFDEVAKAGEWKGETLMEQAKARGFRIVGSLDEMNTVSAANPDDPLIGLFAPGNLPVRWLGPKASYHGNIDKEPVTCQPNPARSADIPTLAQMTAKAIDLLKANPKGFFLQAEAASIDKQDHAANPCGQIGETVGLDEAVQVALDFARSNGKTLVIVTADHAHSSQIVYPEAKAPGLTEALMTKDGAKMSVSYGNSEGPAQGHTGTQLRVAAYGPWAANFTGLTDQSDMFYTIRDALGITPADR